MPGQEEKLRSFTIQDKHGAKSCVAGKPCSVVGVLF